ncbi:exported hypothetical protein [Actinacidiphila bryophytorum]|uniref:AraC-type arabinose-binding/dimerisation domain-containing protein n=1 Tax=Actinacidiphila bryophytorum TaxID=1436133 RepID=A0A9W4H4F5_9ACTN|nr:exported hypothetical protein [Actinacidiphila bryophytorum]
MCRGRRSRRSRCRRPAAGRSGSGHGRHGRRPPAAERPPRTPRSPSMRRERGRKSPCASPSLKPRHLAALPEACGAVGRALRATEDHVAQPVSPGHHLACYRYDANQCPFTANLPGAPVRPHIWPSGGRCLGASGDTSAVQSHAYAHLVYTVGGVLVVPTEGGTSTVPADQAAWTPAVFTYRHRAHGDTDMRIVFVPPSLARLLPDRPAVFLASGLARDGPARSDRPANQPQLHGVMRSSPARVHRGRPHPRRRRCARIAACRYRDQLTKRGRCSTCRGGRPWRWPGTPTARAGSPSVPF